VVTALYIEIEHAGLHGCGDVSWACSSKILKAPWFFEIPKNLLPSDTVSHLRRCASSSTTTTLLWECQISQKCTHFSVSQKIKLRIVRIFFWNWTSLYFRTRCDHKIQHMSLPQ